MAAPTVTNPITNFYRAWPAPARGLCVALVFLLSAACEIVGGWLVWRSLRGPHAGAAGHGAGPSLAPPAPALAAAALGSLTLVAYGVVAAMTPLEDFGRAYAAYGGVFVAASFAWAAAVDGFRLDVGDVVGCVVVLVGVVIIVAWPR